MRNENEDGSALRLVVKALDALRAEKAQRTATIDSIGVSADPASGRSVDDRLAEAVAHVSSALAILDGLRSEIMAAIWLEQALCELRRDPSNGPVEP